MLKEIVFFTITVLTSKPQPGSSYFLQGIKLLAHSLNSFGEASARIGTWLYHEDASKTVEFETQLLFKIVQTLSISHRANRSAVDIFASEYDLHIPLIKILQGSTNLKLTTMTFNLISSLSSRVNSRLATEFVNRGVLDLI